MITFGLDLNLIPGKVLPRLNVSQYDKGQTVNVALWDGDVPYSIPAGCTAQVAGTKADKTGFMYECTIENGQPSFVITDQMTVFPGEVTLEVIIMDADNRIGTVNFILDVERAALADDTQISESDMPIIQQLPEIRAEVEAAAALAEAWAVGPGTEQEPSATNNAYYWAMQAASAAGGGLQPSVVQELPTQNISTSTIYFVPSSDPSASNYYDEYINLDGTSQGWELIGTTAIDLTDYYTKGEVDALLATINGNVTTLDTQLKACSGQAAPYSTTKNYVPTDMVYYNDMLYQCIGAHTGAWDDLYFEPVDLSLLQTRYNNLNTHLNDKADKTWTALPADAQGHFQLPSNCNEIFVQVYTDSGLLATAYMLKVLLATTDRFIYAGGTISASNTIGASIGMSNRRVFLASVYINGAAANGTLSVLVR